MEIFGVLLKMLVELVYPLAQEGDLDFGGAGIFFAPPEISHNIHFFIARE